MPDGLYNDLILLLTEVTKGIPRHKKAYLYLLRSQTMCCMHFWCMLGWDPSHVSALHLFPCTSRKGCWHPITTGTRLVSEEMWQPACCLSVIDCPAGVAHGQQLCLSKVQACLKTDMNFHEKPHRDIQHNDPISWLMYISC